MSYTVTQPSTLEEQGLEEQGLEEQGPEEQGLEEQGLEEQGPEEQGLEEQGLEEQGLGEQGLEEQGLEEQGLEEQGLEEQGPEEQGLEEDWTIADCHDNNTTHDSWQNIGENQRIVGKMNALDLTAAKEDNIPPGKDSRHLKETRDGLITPATDSNQLTGDKDGLIPPGKDFQQLTGTKEGLIPPGKDFQQLTGAKDGLIPPRIIIRSPETLTPPFTPELGGRGGKGRRIPSIIIRSPTVESSPVTTDDELTRDQTKRSTLQIPDHIEIENVVETQTDKFVENGISPMAQKHVLQHKIKIGNTRQRERSGDKRRAMFRHPNLLNDGDRFIASLRKRDVTTVKSLQNNTKLKLHTYTNEYGESAAESAVQSGSTEMVDALLDGADKKSRMNLIKYCMLFAVRNDHIIILTHLLNRKKLLRQSSKFQQTVADLLNEPEDGAEERRDSFGQGSSMEAVVMHVMGRSSESMNSGIAHFMDRDEFDDAEYSEDVTPLILAAQLERSEMIQILIKELPDIHPISQNCQKKGCYLCRDRDEFTSKQSIEECRRSIEVLSALSSPAFILIACADDPILEAFKLSNEIQRRARYDSAFRESYVSIDKMCRQFATDLLGLCRSTREVKLLVNKREGLEVTNAKGERARFPRLQVAIHYRQKEFIAHPNCQQVLNQAWTAGLPNWVCRERLHTLRRIAYYATMVLCTPLVFLVYMFPFYNCCSCKHSIVQFEKFVKAPVGKHFNDTLSFLVFVILLFTSCTFGSSEKTCRVMSGLDWIVFIWLLGLTARFMKINYYRRLKGLSHPFRADSTWQIDDVIMLLCFWLAHVFKLACFAQSDQIEERSKWKVGDLFLISECFLSMGSIISVLHLFSYLKTSSHFGPLQVSLKHMTGQFIRFLFLFFVVMSAFALGTTTIYQSYDYRVDEENYANEKFTSLHQTYKTLFWSLFGYGEADDADLIKTGHRINELLGYTLYGLYHVVGIIVLANILIAMIANSYNYIQENAGVEWRFTRTQLRLSYFNEIGCLPPPFNLIPTRRIIKWLLKKVQWPCQCMKKLGQNKTQRASFNEKEYKELMDRLKKRYWKMRERDLDRVSKRNTISLDISGDISV